MCRGGGVEETLRYHTNASQCPITKIFGEEVNIRLVRQTDNIKFAKYSCQYSKSQISHKQLFLAAKAAL